MCSALDTEHLGADIPDTKIVTPRVLRMSGDMADPESVYRNIETGQLKSFWPAPPYDWERLVADALDVVEAHKPHPSRWQRAKDRIAALRMSW